MRGIHRWPVNSSHKGPVTRKIFPFDDVILILCILILTGPNHQWINSSIHWNCCPAYVILWQVHCTQMPCVKHMNAPPPPPPPPTHTHTHTYTHTHIFIRCAIFVYCVLRVCRYVWISQMLINQDMICFAAQIAIFDVSPWCDSTVPYACIICHLSLNPVDLLAFIFF